MLTYEYIAYITATTTKVSICWYKTYIYVNVCECLQLYVRVSILQTVVRLVVARPGMQFRSWCILYCLNANMGSQSSRNMLLLLLIFTRLLFISSIQLLLLLFLLLDRSSSPTNIIMWSFVFFFSFFYWTFSYNFCCFNKTFAFFSDCHSLFHGILFIFVCCLCLVCLLLWYLH